MAEKANWKPDEIRKLRADLRLRQCDMAWILGISEGHYRRLEHGKRRVTPTVALKLDLMAGLWQKGDFVSAIRQFVFVQLRRRRIKMTRLGAVSYRVLRRCLDNGGITLHSLARIFLALNVTVEDFARFVLIHSREGEGGDSDT